MTYVKAVLLALVAAVLLGLAAGVMDAIRLLPPEDKATFVAASISCATNSIAFYALVLIPAAIAIASAGRRRARGP